MIHFLKEFLIRRVPPICFLIGNNQYFGTVILRSNHLYDAQDTKILLWGKTLYSSLLFQWPKNVQVTFLVCPSNVVDFWWVVIVSEFNIVTTRSPTLLGKL